MELRKTMDEIMQRLLLLPDMIAEKHEQANHKEEIDGLKNTLKDRIIDLAEEAGMELDDNGKKKYTNKDQREARARELAENDDHFTVARSRLRELQDTHTMLNNEIDQLRNELTAKKAVLYALSERLHYESIRYATANNTQKVEIALCHTKL